jgi:hypothetical protein
MNAELRTRLLMALHGIPLSALERRTAASQTILDLLRGLVREELRALSSDAHGLTFDDAMRLLSVESDSSDDVLAHVEEVKRELGLRVTSTPDISRSVACDSRTIPPRSPGAGIQVRDLWRDGDRRAILVTMPPGSKWPGIDYHVPGPEEVYIVSGDLDDGPAQYTAGTFIHYPAGSSHSPSTRTGCTLFVFYPEG